MADWPTDASMTNINIRSPKNKYSIYQVRIITIIILDVVLSFKGPSIAKCQKKDFQDDERRWERKSQQTDTHSSAGSGAAAAAAAAAAAVSPGGGCSAGTAFEDLAGVDVGDTLFVGDPWKKDRDAPL